MTRSAIFIIAIFFLAALAAMLVRNVPTEDGPPDGEGVKHELIEVDAPAAGAVITSPLAVSGRARGPWYFEGDFPLVLTDWDGRIIAEGYASAQGEWMTEEFVPFTGTLVFEAPPKINGFSDRGTLIFRKDNPSGLPEHDDALEITVYFESGRPSPQEQFRKDLIALGVERVGQPIEGFDAFLLMQAFPGLVASDFDGVETLEGRYEVRDGVIVFKRTQGRSSAEQTVSGEGYATLLENLSVRLNISLGDPRAIKMIIENIIPAEGGGILPFDSGVRGTVLLGPMCPVVREGDTSCDDKPYATTIEIFRASNTEVPFTITTSAVDGTYEAALPPGEYTVKPLGGAPLPSCGERAVTVGVSGFAELDLSCDTGIR